MEKAKIKIEGIYPGYKGGDINPAILIESMLLIQGQIEYYTEQLHEILEEHDATKYRVKKISSDIEDLIAYGMAMSHSFPSFALKNKEIMMAYIKAEAKRQEYEKFKEELDKNERQLVLLSSQVNKYKLVIETMQESINTGIQVLSYLKHEQKMAGSGAY